MNHFLSADTIVPGYTNPQSLNRYSYVSNNPLRYTDPTGHMQASDDYEDSDGKCGSADKGCNDMLKRIKDKQDKAKKDKENGRLEVFEGIIHTAEGAVFASAGIAALVLSFNAGPVALIAAPGFLLVIATGTNWGLVGVQEINAGLHPDENIQVDYLPLVHLFFPDALRGRSQQ